MAGAVSPGMDITKPRRPERLVRRARFEHHRDSGRPRPLCHDLIGEPTLADAILDRIIHNAHRLQLKGDSLRKQKAPKTVAA